MAIALTVRLGSFDTLPMAGTRRHDGERDGRGIRQGNCASGRWAALELLGVVAPVCQMPRGGEAELFGRH
jgi:hypothetical protein